MKPSPNDVRIHNDLLSCKTVYDEKQALLRLRANESFEIALIVSGTGIHHVLDKDIPCAQGDIFIIPPNTPHGYFVETSDAQMSVRQLFFFVEDWFVSDVSNSASRRFCYGAFRESQTLGYAVLNSRMQEKIQSIWDLIEYEISAREEEWKDAVSDMLSYLMIVISRYINSAIKNISFASCDEWSIVLRAINIIRDEYGSRTLSQEELAKRLYVSKSHFGRIFTKITGKFFSDYLRNVRMMHVLTLLENTDENIQTVAECCGFHNMAAFYKSFGESVGMTPKEYRERSVQTDDESDEYKKLLKGEKVMSILNEISENLQKGKAKIVKELVQQALDEGVRPADILEQGLLHGMGIIGEKFKNNEVYVPEVLVAARAMNMGAQILKPHLAADGVTATGKVCIGTVQGDLHDIGKNLVKMMLEGKGLEVVDLGTDVAPEAFVQAAVEQNCQVICCSALLTTTMPVMADVVKAAEAAGIRDKVKIMIGGAPVSQEYCDQIGADCYTVDAASAADAAVAFCKA